ncbi:MAG: polyketide synthase dehydratase domain-containing protein, partial [Pseudonocardiaceae bacterium]
MATAFVQGVAVRWERAFAGAGRADLPTYAFQHQRYWLNVTNSPTTSLAELGQASADHPLMGAVVELADTNGIVFTGRLSLTTQPWLADHVVWGTTLLPGAAIVEVITHAGRQVECPRIDELTLQAPLILPDKGGVAIQVAVGAPDESSRRPVTVHSRWASSQNSPEEPGRWLLHAAGSLAPAEADPVRTDPRAWPPADATPVDVDDVYRRLAERGYGYGPAFQGIRAIWRRGDEVFGEVALPPGQRVDAARFRIHPALLDAALQIPIVGMLEESTETIMPVSWNGIALHRAGASTLRVSFRLESGYATLRATTLRVTDELGQPVATIDSLAGRPVGPEQVRAMLSAHAGHSSGVDGWRYQVTWKLLPDNQPESLAGIWLVAVPEGYQDSNWVTAVVRGLTAHAPRVRQLTVGAADLDRAELAQRVREVVPQDEPLDGVVSLLAADESAYLRLPAVPMGLAATVTLTQALLDTEIEAPLWAVTRGAVSVGDDDSLTAPTQALIWGLGRVIGLEQPRAWGGVVDLPEEPTEAVLAALVGVVGGVGECEVAVRPGGVFGRR